MTERIGDIRAEAHEWRARIDGAELDREDRRAFDRWMAADPLHAAAYAEAEVIWKGLGALDYDPALDQPLPDEQTGAGVVRSWQSSIRLLAAGGVAAFAALAAVFVALPFLHKTPSGNMAADAPVVATYVTAPREVRDVTLTDGSMVTLGALSEISFMVGEGLRTAKLLSGHAFFHVAKNPDAPFIVEIGGAKVIVTGTAFDLQRRGDRVDVSVSEGSVRVTHALVIGETDAVSAWEADASRSMVQSATLTAGERITASRTNGLGQKRVIAVEEIGAWRSGQLVYLNAPLGDIVADLNRYADTPIKIDAAARKLRLSGAFPADDVDGLLDLLETALPVRVMEKDAVQVIEIVN
ncbi:MAG: FecR domain-containing protein [Pseudomonadota bacterium]